MAAKFNNGGDFESGSSEYLSIADGSQTGLDITGDISIVAWVKKESAGSFQFIATKYDYGSADRSYAFLFDSSDNLQFKYDDLGAGVNQNVEDSDGAFSKTGVWYHVAVSADVSAKDVKLYVDGVLVPSTLTDGGATSIYNGSAAFALGCQFNSGAVESEFDGIMDDVAVFDRVLSHAEVLELYGSGRAVWSDGYQGVYHLQGGVARDSSPNAYDMNAGTFPAIPIVAGQVGDGMDFQSSNNEYFKYIRC